MSRSSLLPYGSGILSERGCRAPGTWSIQVPLVGCRVMIHAFQYRRGGGGSIRDVPRVRFVLSGAVRAGPACMRTILSIIP